MSTRLRRSEDNLILVGVFAGGLYLVVGVFDTQLYFAVDSADFVVLHTLLELASILVSFSVFIVNWEASKQSRNAQGLFVGTGFLTVAALDTMHTLSYPGMPGLLTANGMNKAAYFWIFARVWAAILLTSAIYVRAGASGWYFGRLFLLVANLILCGAAFLGVALLQDRLPPMFLEGRGLTASKLVLEYAVIAMSLVAVIVYTRAYRATRDESLVLVMAALTVSIFSELAFTLYQTTDDVYVLLGHMYKVVAYYLIFRSLVVSSVHRPHLQLRVAKDRLEETVSVLDARNRELDALDEVAVTLSSTLKPDEVLSTGIRKVMRVMEARAGAVFLRQEETDQLRLAAWFGLPEESVRECLTRSLHLPYGVVSPGSKSDRATTLEDPALVRTLGGAMARIGPLRACSCVPIVSKGRLLGTMAMVGGEGRTFTLRDADLLSAIGYQLGLAIENARLYEQTDERLRQKLDELQKAERRSRFLSEVGALLGSSMDLRLVLGMVARKSTEVMGDWCMIYLLDDRQKLLRLEAVYHSDEGQLRAVAPLLKRHDFRLNEGLVGRVAETGQPLLMPWLSRDEIAAEVQQLAESLEDMAILGRVVPVSLAAAPLRSRRRTLGVLVALATHSEEPFGEADLTLVAELGNRAGVAVENSQLFQENLAQRRHLEAIISQMVDGVVIADRSGQTLLANVAAQRMLGERMDQLLRVMAPSPEAGAEGGGRIQPDGHPLVARALAGEQVMGEELVVGADATKRVLSASASPVRDDSGEVGGAVVVLRDVTAEREIDRMKDDFMATISHELRTPITAVLGYADILLRGLRGPLSPRQEDALGAVRRAGQRQLELINDLLDMSRLEAGKHELLLEPVDVSPAAERAIAAVSVLAASKGISLTLSIPEDLPLVLADEEQLQRILGNLLSNAIKFTPEGGSVVLSAQDGRGVAVGERGGEASSRRDRGSVTLAISDTGIGVPLEMQERIWEKFQQGDSSSRRLFGGTGLGLAITKGLVELHGGRIWVESEGNPGGGSVFRFTLPALQMHAGDSSR